MVIHLDDAATIVGALAALVAVLAGIFAGLRYIIRAETAELRTNGGSTLKDAVNRIEADGKATKAALEEHVSDSKQRIAKGDKVEHELREALSNLAAAIPAIAASTPPEG